RGDRRAAGAPRPLPPRGVARTPDPGPALARQPTRRRWLSDGEDIRAGEIGTLEQQRLAGRFRQGVGKTIADVEPGRVPASAEPAKRLDRRFRLANIDRDPLDFAIVEKRLQIGQP